MASELGCAITTKGPVLCSMISLVMGKPVATAIAPRLVSGPGRGSKMERQSESIRNGSRIRVTGFLWGLSLAIECMEPVPVRIRPLVQDLRNGIGQRLA